MSNLLIQWCKEEMPYWEWYSWERDSLISHGASGYLREKLFLLSDKYKMPVCEKCGLIGHPNKKTCKSCSGQLHIVDIPYASKLLMQELMAMNVIPRVRVSSNNESIFIGV